MKKKRQKIENSTFFPSELYDELNKLKEKFSLSSDELISAIEKTSFKKEDIPLCIFKHSELSSLESIVKYLRENCALKFNEIGTLLNRSQFTISSSYRIAKSKLPDKFSIQTSEYDIPTNIFKDRKLSVLESIVYYLKTKFDLKFTFIASLLKLDQRTIWTVYHRAINKK